MEEAAFGAASDAGEVMELPWVMSHGASSSLRIKMPAAGCIL